MADQLRNNVSESTPTAGGCAAVVEFAFDESTNVLTAQVSEGGPVDVTIDDLREMIDEGGHSEYSFQPDALVSLLRRMQKGEYGEYTIAVRRDADISIGANADKLQVLLNTTRAYGGQPVTEERIREAIAKNGFRADAIIARALSKAAAGEPVSNLVIAQGTEPKAGRDSRVELLVDLEAEETGPKVTESGRVDHYSVRDFIIVDPETHLMRRYPPTKGVAGRDVFGKPIPAHDGRDHPLPKEMQGVQAHPDDRELFVAEYKGHPVAIPGGIRVDKTLVVEHVDLRTGNIDFDGSVLVTGDVSAGVTVKATGDVTVKGSVERAFIHAGGDLLVARGITGTESAMQGGAREVYVEASRDVQVGFASGVRIRADRDVIVKEYLNHCEAVAVGRILVGQSGGRGILVGGHSHGCQGVLVRALGTTANVITHVRVGMHDDLRKAHEGALEEHGALQDRLAQLKAMLASMEERDDGAGDRGNLKEKIRRTVEEYEHRRLEVDRRIEALNGELAGAAQAFVHSDQKVYPGIVVEIGSATLVIRTEGSGGRFTCKNGEIAWD